MSGIIDDKSDTLSLRDSTLSRSSAGRTVDANRRRRPLAPSVSSAKLNLLAHSLPAAAPNLHPVYRAVPRYHHLLVLNWITLKSLLVPRTESRNC